MTHHHQHHPQSFDELAETFDRRAELEGDAFGDWLLTVLPERGGDALDLGCGPGRHAALLAERFEHVLAVDLSPAMIDVARRKRAAPNITYEVADLANVTGQFDLVVTSATLHHVADLEAALAHITTLVRPGGSAMLADVTAFRAQLPRWYYQLGALKQLVNDVVRRRPHAWERFGLMTHQGWLDHMASDRFLSPGEFRRRYAAALPGATFVETGFQVVCRWTKPA